MIPQGTPVGNIPNWSTTGVPGPTIQPGITGTRSIDLRSTNAMSATRTIPAPASRTFRVSMLLGFDDVDGTIQLDCAQGGFFGLLQINALIAPGTDTIVSATNGTSLPINQGGTNTVEYLVDTQGQCFVYVDGILLDQFPYPQGPFCTSAPTFTVSTLASVGFPGDLYVDDVCVGDLTGTTYCVANNNSTGQASTTVVVGSESITHNDFTLSTTGLPFNSSAFYIVSATQGMVANPAGSAGILCLGGAIGRYVGPGEIQNSGLAGAISLGVDLTSPTAIPQPLGGIGVMAGDVYNFQCWHRDIPGTSNFSLPVQVAFRL